jgi:ankyrin repeat protein
MQNQVTSTTETSYRSDSQKLNFTQILYAYVYNMGSPNDAQNSSDTLDFFVENIPSQITPESQSPKLRLLKIALEGVKSHHLAWQKIEGENSQTDTPDSIKNAIKKTLNIYQKYFLTKFSSDGNPDNCDPEIKDRLSNFNDGSEFLNSIMPSTDLSQLKTLAKSLNNYLVGLTIEAESKISEDKDPAEKSEEINKIKTTLLVFPGGTSMESKIVFACLAGSIARVQDGISALNDSSIESTLSTEYIDIFTAILAQKVREVSQIHTSACLLGAFMVDRGKIAEVDNHHISPQEDIGLSDLMKFSHGFAKEIEKKLLLPRDELIEEYKALLATPGGEIEFSAINEFIAKAKNIFVEEATLEKAEENGKKNGFVIDSPYKLFKDEDITIDTAKINASRLISPEALLEKYLRLPTEEFKKELKNALQDPNATMEFDYLKHLPDPKDLFKIANSESGDELITNRLDVKKITNLVELFSSKETDDKTEDNEQKSKVFAGLITLRNILDGYKTGDNGFLFFLKFTNKFKEQNGSNFKDFFFEKHDGNLVVKDEFRQEKSILETIKSRFEYFGRLFMEHSLNQSAPELQELVLELVLLENFGPGQEDRDKLIALISKPKNIAIKNGPQENLLNILYQFDEEAFKLAIETKPELITQIAEKNNKGLSLVNILAQKGDNELLLHVLEKYKEARKSENDPTGSKALIEMIDQQELFLNIIKSNRLDVLEKVIKMVDDESLINFNKPYSFGGTMLCFACLEGRTEIAKMLISKKVDLDKEYEGSGMTPFYIATFGGYTEIAKDLIDNGADFIKANSMGMSPFMVGCKVGHTEIVKALIAKGGIDLNQTLRDGTTPLYMACEKGHTEIVKALIAKGGIDLNQANNIGVSPLHIACEKGHLNIVQELIRAGADLTSKDSNGRTALDLANLNNKTDIVGELNKAITEASSNKPNPKAQNPNSPNSLETKLPSPPPR